MTIRWGLAGLGQLANEWIAQAFKDTNSGYLVACSGSDSERLEHFGSLHKIERRYNRYEDLVRDRSVDAVYIAASNALHHPITLSAARAGKHVLCQKPMALTVHEAEEMVAACKTAGVLLRVGLQLRFQQVLRAAAKEVSKGRIGVVQEVTAQRYAPTHEAKGWRHNLKLAGAGALADVGVHVLDFVQWVVNDRITCVFAFADPPRSSGLPDEKVTMLLKCSGGCHATIRCSRKMPLGRNDLQVFGTEGILATGPLRWVDKHQLTIRTADEFEEREYAVDNLYLREIEAFAEELAGTKTPAATGEEGLQLVRITQALIRSLETGSAISVEG